MVLVEPTERWCSVRYPDEAIVGLRARNTMNPPLILINGHRNSGLSPFDRGLAYGDGLFETIKFSQRKVVLWQQHLARLVSGCRRLAIPFDQQQIDSLVDEVRQLCSAFESDSGVIKLIVTRGAGGRGYRAMPDLKPQRILIATSMPQYPASYYTQGIKLFLCQTRLACNPQLAGIKHLNRLEQVMARNEWQDEYAEGLLRDFSGNVVEGTMSNLFVIKNGAWHTPPLEDYGVSGIVRNIIIDRAGAAGIKVNVKPISLAEVESADGLLMTNSLVGVWPVQGFNGRLYDSLPMAADAQKWLQQAELASLRLGVESDNNIKARL